MRVSQFSLRRVVTAVVVSALALLSLASPSVAQAQYATVVAYEVAEHLKFKGGAGEPDDFRVRFAKAILLGQVVWAAPDAGNPFVVGGFIDADARSFVKATGTGRIVGTFNTLQDFDPTTMLLATMEVTASGSLHGELDLTTALQGYAQVSGKWRVSHKKKGTFQGIFLIPFNISPDPAAPMYVYLDLGPLAGTCPGRLPLGDPSDPATPYACPVSQDEILLRFPLTKAVLVLFRD
ncbi:MAG: hypothetical protein HYY64_04265 [Candidatus Rokubacteria bacterium]|nr:hypothetical protein [Candidatus Rokubacteria bacterium]